MTALDRHKSAPLPLGGSTGSAFDDDDLSSESLGSSIPEFIMLQIILPDGSMQKMEVNSGKQMLDLTIQLTKSNRLSPADYTLAMYHPETGRPVDFKASQMVGTFRIDTVHIVSKKASRDKSKRHTVAQPFEMTYRLAVNLPKNQKTVVRINPHSTLADIFKLVCKERNLDPYKHELRHPTQHNLSLNMANPLASYNINEITVVNITAPDSANNTTTPTSPTSPGTRSIYDSHWTYNNSMPRKKSDSQMAPASAEQSQPSYMPGMTEKKKRKSFLGLFSRKKEGKFKLSDATYHAPSTSSPPPAYEAPMIASSNKPQAEVRPQPKIQQTSTTSINAQITSTASISSQNTSTNSLEVTGQIQKPQRKKRLAPAPPVNKPLSVNTEALPSSQQVHSRGSSHSSGFDETSVSPLESPGSSSEKVTNNAQTKTSIQATSLDSSGHMGNGHVIVEESPVVSSSAASTMSRNSSMSTGGDSTKCSLPRHKKKRPAPPPPPGASKSISSTSSPAHSANSPSGGSLSGHSSSHDTPSHEVTSLDQEDTAEAFDTRELQMAIAEELKKGDNVFPPSLSNTNTTLDGTTVQSGAVPRPCLFSPPPPPDTPPPPESPSSIPTQPFLGQRSKVGVVVADSSTQVHVTLRDSLSSDVSVDGYMDDLVESPQTGQANETNMEIIQNHELLQRQKSDVAVFVDQMKELTEGTKHDDDVTETTTITITTTETVIQQTEHSNQNIPVVADTFEVQDTEYNDEQEAPVFSGQEMQSFHTRFEESNLPNDPLHEQDANEVNISSVYIEHDVPTFQEVVKEAPLVAEDNSFREETLALKLETDSDESSVPSLTAYDICEELSDTDTEKELLPDSIDPVILVKKKIVPEFTLNLEVEEDNDGAPDKEGNEEFVDLPGGEFTTSIKMDDYLAAMTAFDDIAEEPEEDTSGNQEPNEGSPGHEEPQKGSLLQHTHVTNIPLSAAVSSYRRKDSWSDSWQDTPDRVKPVLDHSTEGYPGMAEISLDNVDVMYVSPDEEQLSVATSNVQYSRESNLQQHIGAQPVEPVMHTHSKQLEMKEHEVRLSSHDALQNTSPEPHVSTIEAKDTSPSGGMSLFSIVSGVKSDLKLHVSPPKPEIIQPESASPDASFPRSVSPPPMEAMVTTHVEPDLSNLKDANQDEVEKERETFIIRKPVPYQMPPPELREQNIFTTKTTSRSAAIKESKQPSGEDKDKNDDLQPIIYKTESLAVSRRAQRIPVADSEENKAPLEQEQPRFWGPRPWSARGASEPIPDVNEALARARTAVNKSRELPSNTDYLETDSLIATPTEYSTPLKDMPSPVVGKYSPGKTPSIQTSPKGKCSEISFSPRSEEEEGHSLMEDKSITMLAYPVERKSILKLSGDSEMETRRYNSSTALDSSGADQDKDEVNAQQDCSHYNSSLGLVHVATDENSNMDPMKPFAKVTGKNIETGSETKDKAKKSLQQQYADLQQQFSKWQQQLMDNQQLLVENNMVSQSSDGHRENMSGPPPPFIEGISTYQSTLSEEQLRAQAIAAENYRRLSTPRPFGQQSTDAIFKPRPIMKKLSSFEDQSRRDISSGVSRPELVHQVMSVDAHPKEALHSQEVIHKTLTTSQSYSGPMSQSVVSPPPSSGRRKPRFEPKLDPREELMIAIRSACGRKSLTKSVSEDSGW